MAEESERVFGRLRGCTPLVHGDSVHNDELLPNNKKQRITNGQEAEDRLSALPDCLLLHILSFLDTKQVLRTCLLSKRWQFLWTYTSVIDLYDNNHRTANVRRFVDWVGRMLARCKGVHLNKFSVVFHYQTCFSSDISLFFKFNIGRWVQFAVRNKVKDITLKFSGFMPKNLYVLPQMLYSHSSLTSLNVGCCLMYPRGAIEWVSLKSLSLHGVELSDCLMEKILSCCPVLEVLRLTNLLGPWGFSRLNICSPNLTTLSIEQCNIPNNGVEITAPYVRVLSISDNYCFSQFRLRNTSSVVRADLNFHRRWYMRQASLGSTMNNMIQLLESLRSVEELELGPWCIEVLTLMEMSGWKLPSSTLRCLTLNAWMCQRSIPGILGILKSSPNLGTLIIRGEGVLPWPSVAMGGFAEYLQNLDLVASHLQTVKVTNFTEPVLGDEPMLTLVQILLKRAKVLKKMVISAKELDIAKIAPALLAFPRASPEAVVVFG